MTLEIRILLLNIGRFWKFVWNHFGWLWGSLGDHFASFGGPIWEPKSLILGPWGVLGGTLGHHSRPNQKKNPKRSLRIPWLGAIWEPFWHHVSMIFLSIFRYVFWITFGAILEIFGSQHGAKIIKTSIQNPIKILVGFVIGSWTVLG